MHRNNDIGVHGTLVYKAIKSFLNIILDMQNETLNLPDVSESPALFPNSIKLPQFPAKLIVFLFPLIEHLLQPLYDPYSLIKYVL